MPEAQARSRSGAAAPEHRAVADRPGTLRDWPARVGATHPRGLGAQAPSGRGRKAGSAIAPGDALSGAPLDRRDAGKGWGVGDGKDKSEGESEGPSGPTGEAAGASGGGHRRAADALRIEAAPGVAPRPPPQATPAPPGDPEHAPPGRQRAERTLRRADPPRV